MAKRMVQTMITVSTFQSEPHDHCPNRYKDDHADSLIRLQDQAERAADVAIEDNYELPDGRFPQHSPRAPVVQHSQAPPFHSIAGLVKHYHPNRSKWVETGKTFVDEVDENDPLSQARQESQNIYYPFASKAEWDLAEWLSSSSLPQSSVNEFLHLDWVRLPTISCQLHY